MEQANSDEDRLLRNQEILSQWPTKVDPNLATQEGLHKLFTRRMMAEQSARAMLAGDQLPTHINLCDSHKQWVQDGCPPDHKLAIKKKGVPSPIGVLKHRSLMPMCLECVVKRIEELGLPADKPIGYIDTCLCASTVLITECSFCEILRIAGLRSVYLQKHAIDIEGFHHGKGLTCKCGGCDMPWDIRDPEFNRLPEILRYCAGCRGVVSVPVHAYDGVTHLISPYMKPSYLEPEFSAPPGHWQGNVNECGVVPGTNPPAHDAPTWFARLRRGYQLVKDQEVPRQEPAGREDANTGKDSAAASTASKDFVKPAKRERSMSTTASSPAGALASRPSSVQIKRQKTNSSPKKQQQGGQPSSQASRPSPMRSVQPPSAEPGQHSSVKTAPQARPAPTMLPLQPNGSRSASINRRDSPKLVGSPQSKQQGQSMSSPQALQDSTSSASQPSSIPKPFTNLLNSISPPAHAVQGQHRMSPVNHMRATQPPAATTNTSRPAPSLLPAADIRPSKAFMHTPDPSVPLQTQTGNPLFKHTPDPVNVEAFRQKLLSEYGPGTEAQMRMLLSEYGPGTQGQMRMPWMQGHSATGGESQTGTGGLQMLGASQRRRESFGAGEQKDGGGRDGH